MALARQPAPLRPQLRCRPNRPSLAGSPQPAVGRMDDTHGTRCFVRSVDRQVFSCPRQARVARGVVGIRILFDRESTKRGHWRTVSGLRRREDQPGECVARGRGEKNGIRTARPGVSRTGEFKDDHRPVGDISPSTTSRCEDKVPYGFLAASQQGGSIRGVDRMVDEFSSLPGGQVVTSEWIWWTPSTAPMVGSGRVWVATPKWRSPLAERHSQSQVLSRVAQRLVGNGLVPDCLSCDFSECHSVGSRSTTWRQHRLGAGI